MPSDMIETDTVRNRPLPLKVDKEIKMARQK